MAEKIEISLTDFVGFVNKMGTAKQNHVKTIKERPEYEPYMDFIRRFELQLSICTRKNRAKTSLIKSLRI